MNFANEFNFLVAWMLANPTVVLLTVSGLLLIAFIAFIFLNYKLNKLIKKYRTLTKGSGNKDIEGILLDNAARVQAALEKVEEVERQNRRIEEILTTCVQKVGIVRFNAFDDTGSDLSFAVALLDADNNGVVLSGLFGRNESRTYAKPIKNGTSTYFLTEEEKEAIIKAQG